MKTPVARCEPRTGGGGVRPQPLAVDSQLTGTGHLSSLPGDLQVPEKVALLSEPSDSGEGRIQV